MYTREQVSKIKQEFWTTFGQYMAPQYGADGQKVNWINYKTGYRGLYFRMEADNKQAYIGIVLQQKDADLRTLFWEQLEELRNPLHGMLEEEWQWEPLAYNEYGQAYSHASTTLRPANIYQREGWAEIITFFKQRILLLDEFWSVAQYHFEPLKYL
ncbi:MAG: DUF4268 domain-containing protein [Bacteroidota bacterium]